MARTLMTLALVVSVFGCGDDDGPNTENGDTGGSGGNAIGAEDAASGAGASGEESDAGAAGDDASSGTNGTEGGGGAGSGYCLPDGTWQLRYTSDGSCVPTGDTLRVTIESDGSASVEFVGQGPEADLCVLPSGDAGAESVMGTYSESGEFSPTDCTLTARREGQWCWSGEDQCEEVELDLRFTGDTVSGTGTACRCWCDGGMGCSPEPLEVTGARS